MTEDHIEVTWFDHYREPQCEPNPEYPNGMPIDLRASPSLPGCTKQLPYPAKRCGLFIVACKRCGFSTAITTAGRVDDPRIVTLPCKPN